MSATETNLSENKTYKHPAEAGCFDSSGVYRKAILRKATEVAESASLRGGGENVVSEKFRKSKERRVETLRPLL